MNGWKYLLEGMHEDLLRVEDGEPTDPEYQAWNAAVRDDSTLDKQQRSELIYKMTERCYENLTDGLRIKDLMGDMEEVLTSPTDLKVEWAIEVVHHVMDDDELQEFYEVQETIDDYLDKEGDENDADKFAQQKLYDIIEGLIAECWHDGQTRDCAEAVADRLVEGRRRERALRRG